MKITRDVITDLLPAYFAGEASPDTRALIDDFLRGDPDFARTVEAQKSELVSRGDLPGAGTDLSPDHEVRTLGLTRAMIKRRSRLLGLALMFTAFPLSFAFENGRLTFMLVRDAPTLAAACWLTAVIFWVLYLRMGRRLRTSGL